MVKMFDEAQKGAEWVSIAPIKVGETPACTQSHGPGEKVIDWGGYFWGTKGDLIFLIAADGINGGTPFMINDFNTGKKLFRG